MLSKHATCPPDYVEENQSPLNLFSDFDWCFSLFEFLSLNWIASMFNVTEEKTI